MLILTAAAQPLIQKAATAPQITQAVDDDARIVLTGTHPPPANDLNDMGRAPADGAMSRMLLLLKPAPGQTERLAEYLREIQDPASAKYHRWLTPAQFGIQFAAAAADAQIVSGWLTDRGLRVDAIAAGGQWIEFSGSVAQVETAFQTEIHTYSIDGVRHSSNNSDLRIPAALAPAVAGVVSLDDFAAEASSTRSAAPGDRDRLTPASFAALYHLTPVYSNGLQGDGQSIAVIERSNLRIADVAAFRARSSLPANSPRVIVNGGDPGATSDELEALLDAGWAGAVAPRADVQVIVSTGTAATDGVDLSIAYAVDHASARVIEVGFTACEANLDAIHRQFYNAMWAQAAAEGITVVVAAGDHGAAGCGAGEGLAVNGIASTAYDTAVGGTAFASPPGVISGYLPETGWSDVETARAGGGGASAWTATPDWQVATGVPGTIASSPMQHPRYLPDLALQAGDVAYGLCFEGGCERGETARASGTAAAAAAFAGMMALVDESTGSAQGNAAPVLYALARRGLAFHDVTAGGNRVACVAGSSGCDGTGMLGYAAGPGFDLATGLGSIDAAALVEDYASAAATGTETALVSLSPSSSTVLAGSGFTIHASVIPAASTGATPTGTVTFVDNVAGALGTATLSSGAANFSVPATLAVGAHLLTGQYSGDSTYAAATSSAINAAIVQAAATMALAATSLTPAYGTMFSATATLTATATVNSTQPTGTVAFTVDSTAAGMAILAAGTASSTATLALTVPTPGMHTIGAAYAGDANFAALTASPLTLNVQKGASVTTLVAIPASIVAGTAQTLTATIADAVSGVIPVLGFTGNVVFYDGGLPIGMQVNVTSNQAVLANITLDPTVKHTITAQYYGDGNWVGSVSPPLTLTVALTPTVTTLTASSGGALSGTLLTFTATVAGSSATGTAAPTGTVIFLDGATPIGSGTLATTLGVTTATLFTSSLSGGAHTISARYGGDTNFAPSVSGTVTVTIGSYSVTANPMALTVTAGQSGSVVFTVASALSAPVEFGCQPPADTETSCSFSPASVTGNGQVTMTVATKATTTTTASTLLKDGTAFVCFTLLCLPFGWRANRSLRRGTLAVLALFAAMLVVSCSSNSHLVTVPGTPGGTQVITVITSATVNSQTATQRLYISVNVVQ